MKLIFSYFIIRGEHSSPFFIFEVYVTNKYKGNSIANNYTFSGQDVHVYVYRDLSRDKARDEAIKLAKEGIKSSKADLDQEIEINQSIINEAKRAREAEIKNTLAPLELQRNTQVQQLGFAEQNYEQVVQAYESVDFTDPAAQSAALGDVSQAKAEVEAIKTQISSLDSEIKETRESIESDFLWDTEKASVYRDINEKKKKTLEKFGKAQNIKYLTGARGSSSSVSQKEINDAAEILGTDFGHNNVRAPWKNLGTLDSLSYSTFREKNAVRTLGRSHAVAYTRGPRTIAGNLVFNVMQENELLEFANSSYDETSSRNSGTPMAAMIDQIDPFHMILVFANEYGGYSAMHFYNVDIASENQRMSVHDIVLQNSMTFYSTDMLPIENLGNSFESTYQMLNEVQTKAAADARTRSFSQKLRQEPDAFATSNKSIQDRLQRSRGLF